MPELAPHRFVRREHELFNQLVRFVILNPLQTNRLAAGVDVNFDLGEIEIERAMLEAFAAQ